MTDTFRESLETLFRDPRTSYDQLKRGCLISGSRMGLNPDIAEELFHDVLVKIGETEVGRVDGPAFVYRSYRNRVIDYKRGQGYRGHISIDSLSGEGFNPKDQKTPNPANQAEDADLVAAVQNEISKWPSHLKEVFLAYASGLNYEQIGTLEGVSPRVAALRGQAARVKASALKIRMSKNW